MGYSLLNWVYCAHIQLQPVLSNLTTYLNFTFIFLMFLTSIAELIPSLWISWLMMGVFGSYIYVTTNQIPIISHNNCLFCPCLNCKWSKRWCCRKFHYWLIHCCRCQHRHCFQGIHPCLSSLASPSAVWPSLLVHSNWISIQRGSFSWRIMGIGMITGNYLRGWRS